jgi:hypothetical protein
MDLPTDESLKFALDQSSEAARALPKILAT